MYTVDSYTDMQKAWYENETETMMIENHSVHNSNRDYWDILLAPLKHGDWSQKTVLDFGCGCGRNVQNILNNFTVLEAHGCDISANNIAHCTATTPAVTNGKMNFKFITTDGQSLYPLESNMYDMIMSTIVLQHICVYSIRKKILTDMYRCLKPGGFVSLQMGFGPGHPRTSDYYEDAVHAKSTNSLYDVRVDNVEQIEKDMTDIGFINFTHTISHPWTDSHHYWIYFSAYKETV